MLDRCCSDWSQWDFLHTQSEWRSADETLTLLTHLWILKDTNDKSLLVTYMRF